MGSAAGTGVCRTACRAVVAGDEDGARRHEGGLDHERSGERVQALDHRCVRECLLEPLPEAGVREHELEPRRDGVPEVEEHLPREDVGDRWP
jgi:hypothetical protein